MNKHGITDEFCCHSAVRMLAFEMLFMHTHQGSFLFATWRELPFIFFNRYIYTDVSLFNSHIHCSVFSKAFHLFSMHTTMNGDEGRTTRNRRFTNTPSRMPNVGISESPQDRIGEVIIVKTIKNITVTATKTPTVDRDSPHYRMPVKRGPDNLMGLTPGFSPYPNREIPTPEACEEVYRILSVMHGKVEQPKETPKASLEKAGCGEVPCVLDALLRTLISGNTQMSLADQAIRNLVQAYGLREHGSGAGSINWERVATEPLEKMAQVIKVSGNGKRKPHTSS